jgi:aminoglycoside phosphotransferase (APT) family kinase protein
MLVRMPSAAEYAYQVEKEHQWLPKLAPFLPLAIPVPIAMGKPTDRYPWKWSIYHWIDGESAASAPPLNLCEFATSLAQFLVALQKIDSTDGPIPGLHSFYRGGPLDIYDDETRKAIAVLKGKIDSEAVTEVWETAIATHWRKAPVWVHGDISAGNLLMKGGKLSAVIDFGQLAIGDPACDLAIAWTLFEGESRKTFREILSLDDETWDRGRGWTLWKALIVAAGFTNPNNKESSESWRIINQLLEDQGN